MGYEGEECVHESEEKLKEQQAPVNVDACIRDMDMEKSTAVKSV